MKKSVKSIIAIVFALLTIVSMATTAFALNVTEYQSASWRGNGSATGRGSDDVTIAIEKDKSVTFKGTVDLTVDPKTDAKSVTCTTALRQYHWYGYSTLKTLTLCSNKSIGNSTSAAKTVSYSSSGTAKTTATGEYYCIAKTSGASNAFYNDYSLAVTYAVG